MRLGCASALLRRCIDTKMCCARICTLFIACSLALGMAFSASLSARADINAKHRPEHRALREGHKQGSTSVTKRSETEIPLPVARPPLANLPSDSEAEIPLPIARPTLANLPSDSGAETTLPIARPTSTNPTPDLAAAKQALDLIGRGERLAVTAIEKSTADPVVRELIEWALLRRADSVSFQRYDTFITANPDWPSIPFLRRRAETLLWRERADAATVQSFVDGEPSGATWQASACTCADGRGRPRRCCARSSFGLALGATAAEVETSVLSEFPDVLTPADHQARMDERIGAKDFGAAMRAAKRLGQNQVAIVRACSAAEAKSINAGRLLDAVPAAARDDPSLCIVPHTLAAAERFTWFKYSRSHRNAQRRRCACGRSWLLPCQQRIYGNKIPTNGGANAARWPESFSTSTMPKPPIRWWPRSALPANPYYRAEFHFMAGWIALRFLNDPRMASKHFALIDEGATDPHILARAAYWRGRAAEAAGQIAHMRTQYEAAARYPTAYYGQLARARLGRGDIALRPPPRGADPSRNEILQAAGILYALEERDLALTICVRRGQREQ